MSLNYVLVINSEVTSQAAYSAYQFACELIDQQHIISQVFFYQGISITNALVSPASDEINSTALWQSFAKQHNVALISCISASLRRGVVDDTVATEQHLASANLADGFILGGLGEFVTASASSDRLVQF
jgi:tRNA 2-thiouridine synthesizing protein D